MSSKCGGVREALCDLPKLKRQNFSGGWGLSILFCALSNRESNMLEGMHERSPCTQESNMLHPGN